MLTNVLTYMMCSMVAVALVLAGAPPHPDVGTPNHSLRPRKVSATGDNVAMTVPPPSIARGRRRKRGAIYARFSTKFQASIDDQVRACQDWCEANDVDVPDDMVFIDRSTSGKKSRRAKGRAGSSATGPTSIGLAAEPISCERHSDLAAHGTSLGRLYR
jgi:hypothetical protein